MKMAINKAELADSSAAVFVIVSLMRDPLLLESENYILAQNDFHQPLQQIIFTAIYNIAKTGAQSVTPQDIDLYLKSYPSQYDYYQQRKGYDWLLNTYQATEKSDPHQFTFYYERLKKFSVLRDLVANGFDISDFYDLSQDFLNRDIQDEKLNNISLAEMINQVREKLVVIENRHVGRQEATSQISNEGLRELVETLRNNPEVGLPFDGDILNYAVRGARLGKLYIYSAPSGQGKTRFMVGNACAISLPYIENNQIVVRDGLQKALFVATEMTADEIQTLILAYVSGINEEKILLGSYSEAEERQLKLALEILDKYGHNFIIESMPDPSRAEIRAKLAKYILQEDVEYIFYDYIFSSPGLLGEFRDLEVREDVALMMLSNTLKEIAMTYSVFILSATQLNGNWEKNTVRNANLIRGSKAIVDKVDIGIIGVKLTDEEREQIQEIIKKRLDLPEPNLVMDLYKNRRGKLTGIKIFRYFDYGTCRTQDLYITDTSYRPYVTEDGKTHIVRYATNTYDKLSEIPEEVADNGIPNS